MLATDLRLSEIALAHSTPLVWRENIGLRGLRDLPLRFTFNQRNGFHRSTGIPQYACATTP